MSLIARYLEENALPTVVIGTARDIVETCGVARFVFTDFPLGNPCGESGNVATQRHIVDIALGLLETAMVLRTTVRSPYDWSKGDRWKELVFTEEQPFLEGEAEANWLKAKEAHRRQKNAGKIQ